MLEEEFNVDPSLYSPTLPAVPRPHIITIQPTENEKTPTIHYHADVWEHQLHVLSDREEATESQTKDQTTAIFAVTVFIAIVGAVVLLKRDLTVYEIPQRRLWSVSHYWCC